MYVDPKSRGLTASPQPLIRGKHPPSFIVHSAPFIAIMGGRRLDFRNKSIYRLSDRSQRRLQQDSRKPSLAHSNYVDARVYIFLALQARLIMAFAETEHC